MARPTILTQELADLICSLVEAGNYVEVAAEAAGVGKTTLYRWLKEADEDGASELLVAFRDAYKGAEAEAECDGLCTVKDGWQSNAWFLERRFRARWRRDTPDESQQQQPPQVVVVQLPASAVQQQIQQGDPPK